MTRAYVLVTALPPTKGHLNLIRFAASVAETAEVIICTQPGEPYWAERVAALRAATGTMRVNIHHLHKTLQQEPQGDDPGFWEMWRDLLLMFGLQPGTDLIVTSEPYGADLARVTGTTFVPYDIGRELNGAKATAVRTDPLGRFADLLPEFQPVVRRRITLFGAECVGKTTLSRKLASLLGGHWLFEYARPYLEAPGIGPEVTEAKMATIWRGQKAIQAAADVEACDKPFIVQDTDLFTTVGYWDMWGGNTPDGLVADAVATAADLYLIPSATIAFEADPLRYGGDSRESADAYWIDLCERHGLNYLVLDSPTLDARIRAGLAAIRRDFADNWKLDYPRVGTEYGNPVALSQGVQ
ncbi:AAA family ATPase [Micromonosporaceae bacterium DT55]|uniref:AAA family ATPase n=1 Tax=Melissospora conviva TaxID=3388432 RepID=UPI003C211A97